MIARNAKYKSVCVEMYSPDMVACCASKLTGPAECQGNSTKDREELVAAAQCAVVTLVRRPPGTVNRMHLIWLTENLLKCNLKRKTTAKCHCFETLTNILFQNFSHCYIFAHAKHNGTFEYYNISHFNFSIHLKKRKAIWKCIAMTLQTTFS